MNTEPSAIVQITEHYVRIGLAGESKSRCIIPLRSSAVSKPPAADLRLIEPAYYTEAYYGELEDRMEHALRKAVNG